MALRLDARAPAALAAFWGDLLHRAVLDGPPGPLLAGSATQAGLRFVPGGSAHHLDVGRSPQEGHVVLADPEGDEFCVIRPGSTFLAGCGPLGELPCDGTRRVGLFWAGALGWPLVWDQRGETTVQSPAGGTRIAWGGPPVAPRRTRNRQRFELAVTSGSPAAEVERLVALGASLLDGGAAAGDGGALELADPDGSEFHLTTA